MRTRVVAWLLALSVVATPGLPVAAQASVTTPRPAFADGHGLQVESVTRVGRRLYRLRLRTAALPRPVGVSVLLPVGYSAEPARRYPVLYLFHGATGKGTDWISHGHVKKVLRDAPVITVMPDITLDRAQSGWCTNWSDGSQRWETFHIEQLLPWIDASLRTIPTRGERAAAGLSEGGACSLGYAARHPDLFGTALGFSGVVETWYDAQVRAGATALVNAFEAQDGLVPDTVFGDPATEAISWAAHDPATLASNLADSHVATYWGNGLPGPLDTTTDYPNNNMEGEKLADVDNQAFAARMRSLGLGGRFHGYGPGTHSWPYWTRDLRWALPGLLRHFAHPTPAPRSFHYLSGDDRYTVYGWRVTTRRLAREFSTLTVRSARHLTLSGSGRVSLVTPRRYAPRGAYRVRVTRQGGTSRTRVVRAGADGRLHLRIVLGPSDSQAAALAQAQQPAPEDASRTATVTIEPSRRAR